MELNPWFLSPSRYRSTSDGIIESKQVSINIHIFSRFNYPLIKLNPRAGLKREVFLPLTEYFYSFHHEETFMSITTLNNQ